MADKPVLTLVRDCGMNLRTRRARSPLNRVNVRSQRVPTDTGATLDFKDPLCGDLLAPLRDGLRSDLHQGGQGSLGAGLLDEQIEGGTVHGGQQYTSSLQLSTVSSLPSQPLPDEYLLMVDKPPVKRVAPAPAPGDYDSFTKWLEDSIAHYGMPAALGRWCGVERQNVARWQGGSLPEGQALQRKIAEWAQVDYEALRELIARHREAKAEARIAAKNRPPKKKASLRVAR